MGDQSSSASKLAAGMSTTAAIMAALAYLKSGKAEAAEGIPTELMELVIAIASSADNVDENTLAIIAAIANLKVGGIGWPANTDGTRTFSIQCAAVATPYQVSDMEIPDGMALAIKSSPANALASVILVARTPAECLNPNSSWPLILNESMTYKVKNANAFYVSANVPGSIAIFSAEQRS